MSVPTYERYKDTGVEWLGEVPDHWQIARAKSTISSSQNGIWGQEAAGDERDILCVRVADFDRQRLIVKERVPTLRSTTLAEREGRVLRRGDLLLEKSGGGDLQPVGCVVLYESDQEAICSNFIARMVIAPGFDASFCRYLHFAMYALRLTTRSINQTSGIQNLDQSAYLNEVVPLPTLEEQKSIAGFLEQETAKIDALIEEQRRLIELLKEKRQAVISHAVTKGLDLAAPMKDSRVGWIGVIPAHWKVAGLTKYLRSVVDYRGRTPTKTEQGVFLVTAKNVRNGRIDYAASQEYIGASQYEEVMRRGRPELGEILFTTEAPLGQVGLIDRTDIALAQRILKFSADGQVLTNNYLMFWIMGSSCQFNLEMLATGSTALGIKGSKVGSVQMCIPPIEEQASISHYLEQELRVFDSVAAECQIAIDLLNERRSALISAAVTGKIDVRNYYSQGAAIPEELYEPA